MFTLHFINGIFMCKELDKVKINNKSYDIQNFPIKLALGIWYSIEKSNKYTFIPNEDLNSIKVYVLPYYFFTETSSRLIIGDATSINEQPRRYRNIYQAYYDPYLFCYTFFYSYDFPSITKNESAPCIYDPKWVASFLEQAKSVISNYDLEETELTNLIKKPKKFKTTQFTFYENLYENIYTECLCDKELVFEIDLENNGSLKQVSYDPQKKLLAFFGDNCNYDRNIQSSHYFFSNKVSLFSYVDFLDEIKKQLKKTKNKKLSNQGEIVYE